MPAENDDDTELAETVRAGVAAEEAPTGRMSRPVEPAVEIAGQFVLRRKLGEGAFGVAFLADQLRTGTTEVWRSVVVKLTQFRPEDSPELAARFVREAAVLATLDNHHLVKVFGFGEISRGQLYIAMEFGGDETLADLLRREKALPWQRALAIGRQICEALEEAHRRGVIHRDLKPANILLSVRDGRDWVKVVDFGIAHLARELTLNRDAPALTAQGAFLGTPAYAPPEQVEGSTIDARADLFSLGVILFELIAGERPFASFRNALAESEARPTPVPLPTERRRGVPRRVKAFLARALSKDRTARFQSAKDMTRALDSLLADSAAVGGAGARRTVLGALVTLLALSATGVLAARAVKHSGAPATLPAAGLLLRVPQAEVRVRAPGVSPEAANPVVPLSSAGEMELTEPASDWKVLLSYSRDAQGVHARLKSTPEADVLEGDRSMGATPTLDFGPEPRRLVLRAAGGRELVLIARVEAGTTR